MPARSPLPGGAGPPRHEVLARSRSASGVLRPAVRHPGHRCWTTQLALNGDDGVVFTNGRTLYVSDLVDDDEQWMRGVNVRGRPVLVKPDRVRSTVVPDAQHVPDQRLQIEGASVRVSTCATPRPRGAGRGFPAPPDHNLEVPQSVKPSSED
jgi:hypothetical protein